MTAAERRRQANDRARRRAIRALAAQMGVPYSVAARLIADPHRALMFAHREQRPFHARVSDTRDAAAPPLGRAAHLTARFPRLHTPAGRLYDGRDRQTVLAMLYAVVAHESADLLPAAEELAWVAELGEETAVDITCAALDRGARAVADDDEWRLWSRVEAAVDAGDPRAEATITLGRELRAASLRSSLPGARQTLDAVLLAAHRLKVPGAHVSLGTRTATVVGARWPQSGPPAAYEVRFADDPRIHLVDLGQEQQPAEV
ncbi:hypothetical protein HH310_16855 [Actinoplanes sp. TBRC 11911]|uniref:hypothetical protein n=1 Tax=Actinoplanes sp. TBRC 11911 TaxID=2729386 RepID=UPI00145E6C17|nr:hypothetical protein [Actinoplanes sp. TBRC 11911]NMO52854.1 hypothetical protein [Actinoplanes sp. TBRC 11911]